MYRLLAICVLLGLAGSLYYAFSSEAATALPEQPAASPNSPPESKAEPLRASGRSAPTPAPELRPGQIRMPDGSYLPTLNGVAQPITWTRKDAAPVLRKVVDPGTGMEWYLHEDGLYSTTMMVDKHGKDGVSKQAVLSYARQMRADMKLRR